MADHASPDEMAGDARARTPGAGRPSRAVAGDGQGDRGPPIAGGARIALACAALTATAGLLALLGWALGIAALKSVLPGRIAMQPWTATGLLLGAAALALAALPPAAARGLRRAGAAACALAMGAASWLALVQHATGRDLGTDTLLFGGAVRAAQTWPYPFPGRMTEAAAFSMAALAAALLLRLWRPAGPAAARAGRAGAGLLAGAALAPAVLVLFGYASGLHLLSTFFLGSPVAPHTALALAALAGGTLALPAAAAVPVGRRGAAAADGLRTATLLVGLVLAALLPVIAVGAAAVVQAAQAGRAAAEDRLRDTARALALAMDARIGADVQSLRTLASGITLDPDADPAATAAVLRRVAAALGQPVGLFAPDGRRLLHSALPAGDAPAAPRTGQPEALRRVVETGLPRVLDLHEGAVAGRPVAAVMVPVLREGRVVSVLSMRLEPDRLGATLAAQRTAEGGFAALTDSRHVVVARSDAMHASLVGRPVPPASLRHLEAGEAGVYRAVALDGVERVFAFQRLRAAPGWTVTVAEPAALLDRAWQAPVEGLARGGAVALAAGVVLALLAAGRILRPLRRLTRHARAVARGGPEGAAPGRPPAAPMPIRELEELRRGFAAAEAALAEREQRLRLAQEAGRVGAFRSDLRGGWFFCPPETAALLGLPPDGSHHRIEAWRARILPEDRGRVLAAAEEAVARRLPGITLDYRVRGAGDGAPPRHIEARARYDYAADGTPLAATGVVIDVTERRQAEERQAILAREVDHRAKNVLAVVMSLLSLTRADSPEQYARALRGRVAAMARAHTLLAREHWAGADLRELAAEELAQYRGEAAAAPAAERRVVLDGPPVRLAAGAAQPLAMALHELATNAAKYGALGVPAGRLRLSWRRGEEDGRGGGLVLRWEERGGPPPPEGGPARRGFGSSLLDAILRRQLGGGVDLDWAAEGLACTIRLPAACLQGAAAAAGDSGAAGDAAVGDGQQASAASPRISSRGSTGFSSRGAERIGPVSASASSV